MATVTKRSWRTQAGEQRTGWILTYYDADGKRHRIQKPSKGEAETERIRVEGEIIAGVHVPDRSAVTVGQAATIFLADFERLVETGRRERGTFRKYKEHVRLHIQPRQVAEVKVSRLTGPQCLAFAGELEGRLSDAMAAKVWKTFRGVVDFAIAHGLRAGANPGAAIKLRTAGARAETELEIPAKDDLRDLIRAAEELRETDHGRAEFLVSMLLFGGFRSSELRGMRRADIDVKRGRVRIRQRADEANQIGPVKTKNARRSVPVPRETLAIARRWLMAAPPGELAFPNGIGRVESYANIYNRIWIPLMDRAGLGVAIGSRDNRRFDPDFGMHTLRHAAVSLWIEQNASPKRVSALAGHASVSFTLDTYGHLWPDDVGDQALARGAAASILEE